MAKHKEYFRDADFLQYYVNGKDSVVICKPNPYVGDDGVVQKLAEKVFNDRTFSNMLSEFYFHSKFRIPDSQFIGKAVCAIDDDWDYEIGKRLARVRLEEKAMKLLKRTLEEYAKWNIKTITPGIKKMSKYFQAMEANDVSKN